MTGLIVGKIYYTGRRSGRHPYHRLILILVESQALQTISVVLCLILMVTRVSIP